MRQLGFTIRHSLREIPAVRFEARGSNECWQFDISVSDAHYLAEQKVLHEAGHSGYPHLGLFSVVDDYSRVNYQEYHLVYGEEVAEANGRLLKYLSHYNCQQHPTREGSRIEVWAAGCPAVGFRQMCSWESYATFAREPEYRTVDDHARITLDHQVYRVTDELIGERVEVWKGVFDTGIYVQDKGKDIHGPYEPESGTIPFGTYRRWRKTERDRNLEKVERLSEAVSISRDVMMCDRRSEAERSRVFELRSIPSSPPIGLLPESYLTIKQARRGIYEQFGVPLGGLPDEVLVEIDSILSER